MCKAPKTSATVDNFSKQSREKPPPPAPDPGEASTASASKISRKVFSRTLKKGGRVPASPKRKTAVSKPQNKERTGLKGERAASLPQKTTKKEAPSRASQKDKPSSSRASAASWRSQPQTKGSAKPRITIKLAGRKSSKRAAAAGGRKPVKKLKVVGFKYVSKAKKLTSKPLPSAHVKLKKGRKSADEGPEPEKSKQTRLRPPAQGRTSEVRTEGRKAKAKPDGAKAKPEAKRESKRAAKAKAKPEAKRESKRAAKAAGAVPQSAGEAGEGGSSAADLQEGPVGDSAVVEEDGKVKRKLKVGKILGLKLKRVRNPEEPGQDSSAPQAAAGPSSGSASSSSSSSTSTKRKQNKYVWTLTLVKGKGKATKVPRSAGLKKKKTTPATQTPETTEAEGEPEEDQAVEGDRGWVVESKPVEPAEDTTERKPGRRQQSLGRGRRRRRGKLTEKEKEKEEEEEEEVAAAAGEPTPDAEAPASTSDVEAPAPAPADPEIVEKPLEPLVSSRKKRAARRSSLSVRRKAKARGSKVEPAVGSDVKTVLEPEPEPEPSTESDVPLGPTAVGKKGPRRPRSTGRRKAKRQQTDVINEIPAVPALPSPDLLDPADAESPVVAAAPPTPTLSPKQRRKRATAPTKSGDAEPKPEPEPDPADLGAEGPEMQARSTDLILVLDPPVSETRSESAVRSYGRKPCRRRRPSARRRRKAKVRLTRAAGEEAAGEEAAGEEAAGEEAAGEEAAGEEAAGEEAAGEEATSSVLPARQRLAGVVKAKYMRKLATPFLPAKRPRGRPLSLAKQAQRELAQQLLSNAGKGGGSDSQHPASKDLQRGKSKFLKNIRHFIMPVVSARSSRVIKTPKRFMDDDGMSVLPRRSSPKKPHGRTAREANKEADEGEGGEEGDDDYQYPEQFSPEMDLSPGDQEAFDLFDRRAAEEARGRAGLESRLASDAAASPAALPGKRRSALREPSFRWSNLAGSAGEVFSLVGRQAFDDSLKLPEVILASPGPKRAASAQLSHRETHLKIYESLKKLTARAGRRAEEEEEEEEESSPAEAAPLDRDDDDPEPGHLTLSLPAAVGQLQESSEEEDLPEKEKLKIEDMDSPGVVRKVAVRLRSPGSELLLGEGSDEGVEEADQSTGSDRVEVEERGTSHKIRLTGANKRMFHLLKRAKVQLIKIDQQKQLKSTQLLSGTVRADPKEPPGAVKRRKVVRKRKARLESPPQEESSAPQEPAPAGPRIKHVCRDAAVVLGQPRAMVPDDVPRLSALPLHERDGIAASPRAEGDFASLDGSGRGGDSEESSSRLRRMNISRNLQGRRRPDKSQLDQTPPSVLAALVSGFARREKEPSSPVHKIRVDFKEDCNLRNTWLMGGLSILASVPVMPQYACLLCASKGQHEPLLECERCQNSYHPACLGPNYPKPNKKKKSWVCMTCIRCKSCGVTPGKSWDSEWNHDTSLCPDCTKLYEQGKNPLIPHHSRARETCTSSLIPHH
ncbi:Histone-lysine N-methyltransferase 2B [Acipenser ruthenus]|uniref:Histone-lysine N-methyltransferase 2B n=1 Tax=Acipenser ruthenus TaxID=7906 RepID=A0A444UUG3_ACIRT|nr:Histone-lysine N-methyltransferase 2B [Acipenser ruthenus]